MNRTNLRIISKAGFLFVFIGFFMPFVLNQNGFQVAGYLSQFLGGNAVTTSLYVVFFISCVGGLLFFLLIMKKEFSIIIDWVIIIAAGIAMMIIFSEVSKVVGRSNSTSEYLQSGAYMAIVGIIVSAIFNLIASFAKEGNNSSKTIDYYSPGDLRNSISKKCPFCAEEIKSEAKICFHCGKNVQEYEIELKKKEEENKKREEEDKKRREQEMSEKIKNILPKLFNDENIMNEAKDLRRIYGKGVYVSFLENKAKELGLGDIDLNENDIE